MQRRALVQTMVDYNVTIGHAGDDRHLMGDKHDGRVLTQVVDDAIDLLLKVLVDIRQRLVEHYDIRVDTIARPSSVRCN